MVVQARAQRKVWVVTQNVKLSSKKSSLKEEARTRVANVLDETEGERN
jgi:hypothetical protein